MTRVMRSVGRTVALAVAWGIAWAPIAILIGTLIIDPDDSMDEMWVVVGVYAGFICAVLFCALRAVADRGRRVDELSLPRVAALGAIAGLILGGFPLVIGGDPRPGSLDLLGPAVAGSFMALSAASAVVTALVARSRERRRIQRA